MNLNTSARGLSPVVGLLLMVATTAYLVGLMALAINLAISLSLPSPFESVYLGSFVIFLGVMLYSVATSEPEQQDTTESESFHD